MDLTKYKKIVFFTGAGMSAESGIPTYRGEGGIWENYNFEEYACQKAFDKDPEKVLGFHEIRRRAILKCTPHKGHQIITNLQKETLEIAIVTQNIDGMHQRAGSSNVIELHGNIWRLICPNHNVTEDFGKFYKTYKCPECNEYLRPDIVWFGDRLDIEVTSKAEKVISECELLISIGTSGVVWPAAGFPQIAKNNGAFCIEINPEPSKVSELYDYTLRESASKGLEKLFL